MDITAARPMSRLTPMAAIGNVSASGTAMAGGSVAFEFAADTRSPALKTNPVIPKPVCFSKNAFGYWPEKTVFQANALPAFT
jgi:hypothetical protein